MKAEKDPATELIDLDWRSSETQEDCFENPFQHSYLEKKTKPNDQPSRVDFQVPQTLVLKGFF